MVFKALATAALMSVALSGLSAQETRRLAEPESVPTELASVLAANGGGFGGEPQILVGAMPEWASSRLVIPQGGRIVGSAFLGMTVMAVVSVPGEPDSAVTSLKNQLLQRGWKNPPPAPNYGGGFRPAPNSLPSGNSLRTTLCGDQQMLVVSGARRRLGGSEITYRLVSTAGYSVCRPQELPPQAYRSPYPTLYNPTTAVEQFVNGGCSSNFSGGGTSTVLRTSMTAEALLDYYGRQIADSGWAAAGPIAGRTWTKKDSTGALQEISITVTPGTQDVGCQRLDMQLKTFRKP